MKYGRAIIAAARRGAGEGSDGKISRAHLSHLSRFAFVLRVADAAAGAVFHAAYTRAFASATVSTADRDTITKHFHAAVAFRDVSRGISVARESVGYRDERLDC